MFLFSSPDRWESGVRAKIPLRLRGALRACLFSAHLGPPTDPCASKFVPCGFFAASPLRKISFASFPCAPEAVNSPYLNTTRTSSPHSLSHLRLRLYASRFTLTSFRIDTLSAPVRSYITVVCTVARTRIQKHHNRSQQLHSSINPPPNTHTTCSPASPPAPRAPLSATTPPPPRQVAQRASSTWPEQSRSRVRLLQPHNAALRSNRCQVRSRPRCPSCGPSAAR